MDKQPIKEFFKLDSRKITVLVVFIIIGFVIALGYLSMLLFHSSILGENPSALLLGMIAILSPLFGLAITYLYVFKTIPITLAITINFLLVLQFAHWYYMSCMVVYIRDKFFKEKEWEFKQPNDVTI